MNIEKSAISARRLFMRGLLLFWAAAIIFTPVLRLLRGRGNEPCVTNLYGAGDAFMR